MTDETDAELFVEAQDTVWATVISELTEGKKQSHWMWFVFPQLASLGQSHMAQLYGIHNLAEARAYLSDPVLRERLVEVCRLLLSHSGKQAETILGPTDAQKLRSSMTLFSAVPDAPAVFTGVLETFYNGERCAVTDKELRA
ncbi:DUF1810 domain-containing protein [Sedimentitalea todarodis]|uniref:DUF1810 domain-containing protein n=1 Tax=Sedimentitalea todarodis TaxID=1631240 RepID=A0ABU3VDJ8_9RHOB|nr:DUF1810 domain-containing protein [Sedimentitalea todarodis]MDU9004257.1 DUF1810 domain-containing protein [Sedimentitalea todarodis]